MEEILSGSAWTMLSMNDLLYFSVATPILSFFSLRVPIYITFGRYKVHLFRRGRVYFLNLKSPTVKDLLFYCLLGASFPAPSGGTVFAEILRSEVLDGTNYVDWKQRVEMLLTFYGYKDIIFGEQPILPEPVTDPDQQAVYDERFKKYSDWELVNDVSKSYVLSGLSKTLRMTYFQTPTVRQILDKLEVKFGKKSDSHVNNLWKKFTRAKCEEGTEVRKHVNEMVAMADELDFNGRSIDGK